MALVNQIIDFVDDIDRSILKEAAAQAPRQFHNANILTAEDRERLSSDQFALVMRTKEAQVLKKFPITDAANTWLSCQYFEKTSEQLPYVAQKIAATQLKRACLVYGIKAPEIIEKTASTSVSGNHYDEVKYWKEDRQKMQQVKLARAEHDGSEHFYALGNRYAMPSPDYVKKAAAYFSDHCHEFSDAEDRATFAHNVRQRARELGVGLDKTAQATIESYTGSSYGDSVGTQLKLRQELVQNKTELSSALSKLASYKENTNPQVFAKVLYQFDKKANLTRYYNSYLADAFKATFGTFSKTASAGYVWKDEGSGTSIDGSSLVKAAQDKYEKIKSYFGPTLADSLKKEAVAIFESLPKDAKETIVRISKGEL